MSKLVLMVQTALTYNILQTLSKRIRIVNRVYDAYLSHMCFLGTTGHLS